MAKGFDMFAGDETTVITVILILEKNGKMMACALVKRLASVIHDIVSYWPVTLTSLKPAPMVSDCV